MVGWETAVFEPPITTYETYRTEGDIPVVASRLFPGEDEKLSRFVADAADLADESIVIVDIRDNDGGSSHWGAQWVENLTGVEPAWVPTDQALAKALAAIEAGWLQPPP